MQPSQSCSAEGLPGMSVGFPNFKEKRNCSEMQLFLLEVFWKTSKHSKAAEANFRYILF